jgi:hypothetical protein
VRQVVTPAGAGEFKRDAKPVDHLRMERPPLTIALASVLTAQLDGDRRGLLLSMQSRVGDAAGEAGDSTPSGDAGQALASVTPLPRVIPMPRRHAEQLDPEPDPAA